MHVTKYFFQSLWLALFSIASLHAADCTCATSAPKQEVLKSVKGLKCPVNEKDGCDSGYCSNKVKRDISVEYEGRQVYFCCKGCAEAFGKNSKAYEEQVKTQREAIEANKEKSE